MGSLLGGVVGKVDAAGKKKAYENAENAIPLVDPAQEAYLAKVRQRERELRSGTDMGSALSRQLLRGNVSQTQANLLRSNSANAANNLLRSQRMAAIQGGNITAAGQAGADRMAELERRMVDTIAERTYARQRQRRDQALMDYVYAEQDANERIGGAIAALPTAKFGGVIGRKSAAAGSGMPSGMWQQVGIGGHEPPISLQPETYRTIPYTSRPPITSPSLYDGTPVEIY